MTPFCLFFTPVVEAYSYSVAGKWSDVSQSESLNSILRNQHMLVMGNKTWTDEHGNPFPLYNPEVACEALKRKDIETIYFYGDSYMRQIYAAVLITLNGNYRNGSISTSDWSLRHGGAGCVYAKQFNEKHCGMQQLEEDPVLCNGKLKLHHMHNGGYWINEANGCRHRRHNETKAINVFSTGNHKLVSGGNGRIGVNSAPEHIKLFSAGGGMGFCGQLLKELDDIDKGIGVDMSAGCSNWWMSTHRRIKAHYFDETGNYTRAYNQGMREFFDSGGCGLYNYVDVYNMTQSLVETFTLDDTSEENKQKAYSVSYDLVHYGMEINMIKAQILLDAWIKGMPDIPVRTQTQT